jgi:hypothetical protein
MTPSKTARVRGRVRFKLDDDDELQQEEVPAKKRSVSGMIRMADEKDAWF